MDPNQTCPKCLLPVLPVFYFCPNCGNKLREKPLPVTIGKQIGLYLLSFFLPPLGLWPGIKYLRQDSQNAKIVGGVAIILTIVSTVITSYFTVNLVNQFNRQLNSQLQINQLP